MKITVGPEEQAQGKLFQTKVDQAIKAIRREGYVILENAVSLQHIDMLREKMEGDSQKLIDAAKWGGAGRPLRFNTGCEAAFESSDLEPNAVFTSQPLDYLFAKTL